MSGENCKHIWRCWEPRCHTGFKTTLKLQSGELGQLCIQAAFSVWTHLGQGSFGLLMLQKWWTENADAIDWVASLSPCCFCCTGELDKSARQTFQHDARTHSHTHLHWPAKDHLGLCLLPTTPLFFQMDKRKTEKFVFCSQHRCTDHPHIWSLATFWSERKKQEVNGACLLQ